MIPYGVAFAENEYGLYSNLPSQLRLLSGPMVRLTWNVGTLLLVSAFTCNLRAIMIKLPSPPILKTTEEFMNSERPFLALKPDPITFAAMESSAFEVDRWMFEKHEEVFFWTR